MTFLRRPYFRLLIASIAIAVWGFAAPSHADSLQDTLISVYNKNPKLQAERARLREIDENYIQARAQGRPQVTASGQYTLDASYLRGSNLFNGDGGSDWIYGNPRAAQIQLIQPLYQGGRVKALKQQAMSNILAARERLRAVETDLFLQSANAYADVLRDEEAARIRRNNVMVLSRQLAASQARFDVGEGTRTDIAQSESRLAGAEAGLSQAEAQLEISRAVFKRLVGRMPVDLQTVPQFVVPTDLQSALASARENNPQLMAAYLAEKAGQSAIDVAKGQHRPTVSLNGTVSAQRDQFFGLSSSDQAAITAQISIPIFSGGANKSRLRQARHAKTRLGFEARDTEWAIDAAIAQIWAQLDAAKQSLVASQKQLSAAELAFEGVVLEQSVATRTQLDVLNAEQEVLNAKLNVINAQRSLDGVMFQLLATIGVFDVQGLSLTTDRYDPSENLKSVRDSGLDQLLDKF